MKVCLTIATATLALAAQASFAQAENGSPLTRADVRLQVLNARATGGLSHAGDAAPEEMTPYRAQVLAAPTLTRAQEKEAVSQARIHGELAHAGSIGPEEELAYQRAHPFVSDVSRSEVKAAVLEARRSGTLVPAGEAEVPASRVVPQPSVFARLRDRSSRVEGTSE